MANKTLFASVQGALIAKTDAVNSEGAPAYALCAKEALAQYATTGCFGRTFYTSADMQLDRVLQLCEAAGPEFVARVAIYSRSKAYMRDMPALLCAWLSARDARLHEAVFAQVIDDVANVTQLVQVLRSGIAGGSRWAARPSGWCAWLAASDEAALFSSSVGRVRRFGHHKNGSPEARWGSRELLWLYAGSSTRSRVSA